MSLLPSTCSGELRLEAAKLGASRLGFAAAAPVGKDEAERYAAWIAEGCHGEMSYLDRYHDLRANPEGLLPGARTVIVAAFNYLPARLRDSTYPQFARYAYGRDYHEVVRGRLESLAAIIRERYGGATRVCVDTAPIPERYWAVKAGIGFRGCNSQLIVPGMGSYFFLGEILTTAAFQADEPCLGSCGECGACVKACPAGAIRGDFTVDARRCLSYLTIEYRGELPSGVPMGNHVYGCDVCQEVCPHNRGAVPTDIAEFAPSPEFMSLDGEGMAALTPAGFNAIFRHSAVKRTKLSGLLRNLDFISKK